jgi:hypothetical protein
MSTGRDWAHGPGRILLIALLGLHAVAGFASSPREREAQTDPTVPALAEVIGERGTALIVGDDTLLDVAERNHVGFDALVRLNPGVDVWMPQPGTKLALPSLMIPPRAARRGIVLNVPEMRLYDYTRGGEPQVF